MAGPSRRSGKLSVQSAIEGGERRGSQAFAARRAQLKVRAGAIGRVSARRAPEGVVATASIRKLVGPAAAGGVIVAEGDSWFDYPLHDVLGLLEDDFDYEVESVARMGDRIEGMAYDKGQFDGLARRLEKVIRAGRPIRAILLSGGGNDIAGEEFVLLLNHALSSLPALNESIVSGLIDQRLRASYIALIAGIAEVCRRYLEQVPPIIIHGYDYPIPDGRGVLGGFWLLPGPWLRPGFLKKQHLGLKANTAVMREVIDRFNRMLHEVAAIREFPFVHHLDLRQTLPRAPYEDYWANELHPTHEGFRRVTARFAGLIESL